MQRFTRIAMFCAALAGVAAAALPAPAAAQRFKWTRTVINAGSNFEASGAADINHDGRLDIICGDSWYEAPSWKAHKIMEIPESGGYRLDFANVPMDVNGDGWMDIVSCNWHAMSVVWRENPKGAEGPWKQEVVDRPGNMETGYGADIDADGKLDFLPDVAQKTVWYRLEEGKLVAHEISANIGGHGIGFGDLNGDGRKDVIKPGGWFEAPLDRIKREWVWHAEFSLGATGIEIIAHDFNGDGRADLFAGNGHDYGTFWVEQTGDADPKKKWVRHEVDKDWSQPHAMTLVDLDGDGVQDVLTGKRKYAHDTDPGANDKMCIYVYSFDRHAKKFTRETIHEGDGDGLGLAPTVVDLDGDGDLDLIAPGKSGLYLHMQERGGPKDPKKSAEAMRVPEGFELTLFASEPEIRKPIAFCFDERGRMVIAEAAMYPLGPPPGEKPTDAVKILEDTNGDGRADVVKVFADGLNIPDAVAAGHGGIYIAEAPHLWYMKDTDGDDRADERREILTNFGTQDSHHNVHGLQWTPGGKLLMNQGCSTNSEIQADGKTWGLHHGDFFQCWPDGTGFSIPHHSFTNSWGYDWDDYGNWICNDNEGPHLVHLVENGDYGLSLTDRRAGQPGVLPGVPREYGDERGYLVQSGLTIYSGDAFPAEYQGTVIQGAPKLNRVIVDALDERGASFHAHLRDDLVASSDPWQRCIALTVGPDGAVYMIDWYNEILAHVEHPLGSPRRDKTRGRIYRIGWKDAPRRPTPDLRQASAAELAANLRSDNKWTRRTSQRLLAAMGEAAMEVVLPMLNPEESPRTRCHVLWTLEETRLDSDEDMGPWIHDRVSRALADPDHHVRAAALRVARHIGLRDSRLAERLLALARDENDFVRFEAAMTIAGRSEGISLDAVLPLFNAADGGDPFLAFAFTRALRPYEGMLTTRAFIAGARGLAGEESIYLPALLNLRDPRTEPLFTAMLTLPDLRPHVVGEVVEGLHSFGSEEVKRALVAYLADHPDLPVNLVRPILADLRARKPGGDAGEAATIRRVLTGLAGRGDGLLRDVFQTAAHVGETSLAPRMIASFESEDARVAEAAILACGELKVESAAAPLRRGINGAEGRRRWAMLRALSKVDSDSGDAGLFLGALADPDTSLDALRGLRRIGSEGEGGGGGLLARVMEQVSGEKAVISQRGARDLEDWIRREGGDEAPARLGRLTGKSGVLRDWRIIGPFPNPESRGHATVYPPETELNRDAVYRFIDQDLKWMDRRTDDANGVVNLMDLKPGDHVVAYGWTTFISDKARPATLLCGSDDSIKVWLNGEVVHDNLVDRGLVADQDQASVSLREGENTVLVKCGQNAGGWNFHARIETLPPQVEADPGNRETRAMYQAGNPGRGRDVFYGAVGCARCHAIGDKGGRVGPDLTRVARHNPRSHIARSILKPSEEIAEGYGGVTVTLTNGDEFEGYIHRETPGEVQLVTAEGKTLALRREEIKDRHQHATSGMPDDAAETLSNQQLADLVAFLEERD